MAGDIQSVSLTCAHLVCPQIDGSVGAYELFQPGFVIAVLAGAMAAQRILLSPIHP